MGLWWRSQQWFYARPKVAAAGAISLFALVAAGGWETARLASPGTTQALAESAPHGVAEARLIHVDAEVGPVTRVVEHTRTITATRPAKTVVQRRIATRTVRDTHTLRETVTVATRDAGRARAAHASVGGTRSIRTITVTKVQTETQTQTLTQPPVTVTVVVTTTKGRGH